MSDMLEYRKIRDVKSPERGTEQSAGIDLFIPNDWNDGKDFILRSGEHVLIPSGLKFKFDSGYALIAKNKSGIASKKNITVMAAVCDSDYTGEVHISILNVGTNPQIISAGDKIVQFLLMPVCMNELVENTTLYDTETTERGAGGFGSTGNK